MRLEKMLLALALAGGLLLTQGVGAAASEPAGFSDVDEADWYAGAVAYVRENGLMSGVSDTAFAPGAAMTRGMLATALYRMAGSPPVIEPPSFLDVSLHGWYSEGIAWSAQNYIMGGYGGDRFGPDDPLTREQLATALWRYAGSPEAGAEGNFADEADLSPWAGRAADWAAARGLVGLRDGNRFDPGGIFSRGEAAAALAAGADVL